MWRTEKSKGNCPPADMGAVSVGVWQKVTGKLHLVGSTSKFEVLRISKDRTQQRKKTCGWEGGTGLAQGGSAEEERAGCTGAPQDLLRHPAAVSCNPHRTWQKRSHFKKRVPTWVLPVPAHTLHSSGQGFSCLPQN